MIYDTNPGWALVVEKADGDAALIADRWEERLRDLARYIADFTSGEVVWSDEESGEKVDLSDFVATHE
jgi:hypothetical protein